jgi:dihydrofolate reductase
MRSLKLYIAISLDNHIARSNGSVDWLESVPNPEQHDYGYQTFYDSIDTTLMGFNTYQEILNFGVYFPYPDKSNYVFSRRKPGCTSRRSSDSEMDCCS